MSKRNNIIICSIIFVLFVISLVAIYKVKHINMDDVIVITTTTNGESSIELSSEISNEPIDNTTNNIGTSTNANNTSETIITSNSMVTTKKETSTSNKTVKKETTSTTITTTVDQNDLFRKQIENKYGVKIKYGNEVNGYRPGGYTPNILTNNNDIYSFLNDLYTQISKYPTNFFREFGDMNVTFYLVDSIPNNAFNGLTDKEFATDVKITYVYGYEFMYTFHHELMHYIDYYLDIKYWNGDHYSTFTSFNPEGFTYGNANSSYNFSYNGQGAGNNVYFLNDYAQSNVREDRAELFKLMMGRTLPFGQLFNSSYPTGKKARAIVNEILNEFPSFNTITPNWTKFIN